MVVSTAPNTPQGDHPKLFQAALTFGDDGMTRKEGHALARDGGVVRQELRPFRRGIKQGGDDAEVLGVPHVFALSVRM